MKHTVGVTSSRTLIFISLIVLATAAFAVLPASTHADSLSTQTQQLIPPGMNTCQVVMASAFTPYIYNNELDSFEFTVPDSSYVALVGSAGNTPISFQYMSRRIDPATGAVRIHVDINS